MFFFTLNATWWLKTATAAQRRGGSAAAVTKPATRGRFPKRQWSYTSYDCNESLDHCIHPSTLTADRRRLLLLIFTNPDTRRKTAKTSATRGPRCQIKLSADWKLLTRLPNIKKSPAAVFVLRLVHPRLCPSCFSLLISAPAAEPQTGTKVTSRVWNNL